jgi:hypothetical protein
VTTPTRRARFLYLFPPGTGHWIYLINLHIIYYMLYEPMPITTVIQASDTRLSRIEVTRNYAVKKCGEPYTEWNCDPNAGDIFRHISNLQEILTL